MAYDLKGKKYIIKIPTGIFDQQKYQGRVKNENSDFNWPGIVKNANHNLPPRPSGAECITELAINTEITINSVLYDNEVLCKRQYNDGTKRLQYLAVSVIYNGNKIDGFISSIDGKNKLVPAGTGLAKFKMIEIAEENEENAANEFNTELFMYYSGEEIPFELRAYFSKKLGINYNADKTYAYGGIYLKAIVTLQNSNSNIDQFQFRIKREKTIHAFRNGQKLYYGNLYWNQWSDDTTLLSNIPLPNKNENKIILYDRDAPEIRKFTPYGVANECRTLELYNNFRQYISYNNRKISEYKYWHFIGIYKDNRVVAQMGEGLISLPNNSNPDYLR